MKDVDIPIYTAETTLDKVKFCREAAAVRRCHTVPVLNGDQYVVGLHSFNMLAMLRILYPEARKELIWAIIDHDIPERLTGDIPAPTKWFKIINKDQLNLAEMEINGVLFGEDIVQRLTNRELKILKGLDILELYMFCRDQIMLGNRNTMKMADRIHRFIIGNTHLFAEEVVDLYWKCFNSQWEMMPDLGDEGVGK